MHVTYIIFIECFWAPTMKKKKIKIWTSSSSNEFLGRLTGVTLSYMETAVKESAGSEWIMLRKKESLLANNDSRNADNFLEVLNVWELTPWYFVK